MRIALLILSLFLATLACSLTGARLAVMDDGQPSTSTPTPTAVPSPAPFTCLVTTGVEGGALNVRACAGTHCSVLQVVREGDRLQVVSESDGWLNIGKGWVKANFCRKE